MSVMGIGVFNILIKEIDAQLFPTCFLWSPSSWELAGMTTLEKLLQNVVTCHFTLSATDSPDLHFETQ